MSGDPTPDVVAASAVGSQLDASGLLVRIENVPFSRWHMQARLVMGSATFFDAYNALSLAFALPILIRLWHISPQQSGFLIAASYIGQLAGGLWFGSLAEKYGRIPSATAAVALMSVMSVGCALVGNFPALFACRVIQGIGVGGEMPVAAAYINELSRAHGRGRFFLMYEMIFPLGLMATGQIGAWLVPILGWKIMFWIGGLPGLLIVPFMARLPESPRWLIAKGRKAEAEAIIRQIETSALRKTGDTPHAAVPQSVVEPSRPPASIPDQLQRGRWAEVLSTTYRRRTLVVWTLWASAFFVTNGLNNWMPSLYNTVYHLGLRESLRAASLTNVAQVLLLLICALSIDRVGRRNWIMASFVAGVILLAVLGWGGAGSAASVMILGTISYGILGSANAVLYLYTPEIYPTRIRAIGTGLATSWLRLASAVAPAVVGMMVGTSGIASVFWLFAGISVVGAAASAWMIETRGRRLEEIAA